MGIGQSLLFLPSLTIIGQHFKAKRALATGIAVSVSLPLLAATCQIYSDFQGASVGGIVWPIMLGQLSRWTSFANSVRATAALASGLLVSANLLMSPGQKKTSVTPTAEITSIIRDAPYVVSIASYVSWTSSNLSIDPNSPLVLFVSISDSFSLVSSHILTCRLSHIFII